MAAKGVQRKGTSAGVKEAWDKHGTKVVIAVCVVLLVYIGVRVYQRYGKSQVQSSIAEWKSVNVSEPGAAQHLARIRDECTDEVVASRIQMSIAELHFRRREFVKAGEEYEKVLALKAVTRLDKAKVYLHVAYILTENRDFPAAIEAFQRVEKDKLYADEAVRMIDLIKKDGDKLKVKPPSQDIIDAILKPLEEQGTVTE